jgi:hypothetical protein
MKLQSQVCTLEQAKRLKELGISQESYLYHYFFDNVPRNVSGVWRLHHEYYGRFEHYSAFNVAELGVMIGRGTRMAEAHWQWLIDCVNSGCSGTVAYNAVALAGFIITQLENNITTPEEVNTRLIQS